MGTGTRQKSAKHKACYYDECKLPKNNRKYGLQIVFFILSLMCLAKDSGQLTMVSMFLYLSPIILDLWTTVLDPPWLNRFRIGCAIFDSLICVIIVGGLFTGLLVEMGDSFSVVGTSLIFAEYTITKRFLFLVALVNLVIPIMFWKGSPNQEAMEIAAKVQTIEVKGGK